MLIFFLVSMSRGKRFDHQSCIVTGSIKEVSLAFCESGAVEG